VCLCATCGAGGERAIQRVKLETPEI
jgi:hypothetical protein